MLEAPIVKIDKGQDIFTIIDLCEKALLKKGEELNMVDEYNNAVISMKEKISESKAYIRTLYILMEYCKLI